MELAVFAFSSTSQVTAYDTIPHSTEAYLHPIAITFPRYNPSWESNLDGSFSQVNSQFKGITYDITVLVNLVHLLFQFATVSSKEHQHRAKRPCF